MNPMDMFGANQQQPAAVDPFSANASQPFNA